MLQPLYFGACVRVLHVLEGRRERRRAQLLVQELQGWSRREQQQGIGPVAAESHDRVQ